MAPGGFFDFYIYAPRCGRSCSISSSPGRSHCGNALRRSPPSLSRLWRSDRLCAIRPLRRPGRPQSHAGGFALLTMGISTVINIGLLPGYATIGIFAPLLLALARFGRDWGCGRRMGRRSVISDGECAAAQTRCMAPSHSWAPIGLCHA
ncbi:hypothetical protein KCP77_03135 [Salmonella enterica subsp. enterica]|nr:hypothetical protein KCP77_03135 [Salmonella enterica subsp. enterica]